MSDHELPPISSSSPQTTESLPALSAVLLDCEGLPALPTTSLSCDIESYAKDFERIIDPIYGPGFIRYEDDNRNLRLGCLLCGPEEGKFKPISRIARHMTHVHFTALKYHWLHTEEALERFKARLPQKSCAYCEYGPVFRDDEWVTHLRKCYYFSKATGLSSNFAMKDHPELAFPRVRTPPKYRQRAESREVQRVPYIIIDDDSATDEDAPVLTPRRVIDEDYDGDEAVVLPENVSRMTGVESSLTSPSVQPAASTGGDSGRLRWASVVGATSFTTLPEREGAPEAPLHSEEDQLDPDEYDTNWRHRVDVHMSSPKTCLSDVENLPPEDEHRGRPVLAPQPNNNYGDFDTYTRDGRCASPPQSFSSESIRPPFNPNFDHPITDTAPPALRNPSRPPARDPRKPSRRRARKAAASATSERPGLQIQVQTAQPVERVPVLSAPPHAPTFDRQARIGSVPSSGYELSEAPKRSLEQTANPEAKRTRVDSSPASFTGAPRPTSSATMFPRLVPQDARMSVSYLTSPSGNIAGVAASQQMQMMRPIVHGNPANPYGPPPQSMATITVRRSRNTMHIDMNGDHRTYVDVTDISGIAREAVKECIDKIKTFSIHDVEVVGHLGQLGR